MKQQKNNPTIKLQVQADKGVIPAGKSGERIVEVQLKAPPAAADRTHVPLNLALVMDHSGSMHGDKLHFVKEAAKHVIDLMSEQDRAAVVIYDDKVETLANSQLLTDGVKKGIKQKIDGVRSGGSTFLYGGWLAGSRQVAEALDEKTFNRTLLLTDGLANVGERRPDFLSMHAQELFTRGISTSCFGVGQDYDEHLLEAMSNLGGGNFHFLETVNAIPLVFEREFDEIVNYVLKDVRIILTLPDSINLKVSGGWRLERTGDQVKIYLGSMAADQDQSIYLVLSNLAGGLDDVLSIPVAVSGKDRDEQDHETRAVLELNVVPEPDESAAEKDPGLMERFAVVDLADKATEALKMERAGNRLDSAAFMRQSMTFHQGSISDDTRDKYAKMSEQLAGGMDSLQRKRHHQTSYENKRGYQSIREYRLSFIKGVMIAQVEGLSVLINTAAQTSIGRQSDWRFVDASVQLQNEYQGVSCETLSSRLGTQVDVMLGMDILQDLFLQIDPGRGVIVFSRRPLRYRGWRIPLKMADFAPACKMDFDGKLLDMRLVTSLGLNYVPGSLVQDALPQDEQSDRLLDGPAFTAPVYYLNVQMGHGDFRMACGLMPVQVELGLYLEEGQGVLGSSFLQIAPSTLAFPEGMMVVMV
jgi:Ca-activated chloride channel family protein